MEELVLVLKIMDKLLEVNSLDLEDIENIVGNHLHKKGLKISKAKTTKQYFVLLETQEDKKA